MLKSVSFLFVIFCSLNVFAGTVIFGEPAQEQFEKMLQQHSVDPSSVYKNENIFFGSDSHPTWGKVRMTDLVLLGATYQRCWKEDYFDAGEVVYGCNMPEVY